MKTERQGHGLVFEDYIIKKYGMISSKEYTSEWDAYYRDTPVSIKVAKKGTDVEMADFFRNQNKSEDFYLVVGFWEEKKTNIVEEHILLIPIKFWKGLFLEGFDIKLKTLLDEISNDISDDLEWSRRIGELRREWGRKTPNLVRPRFKRDHKKQKRIQCAINNRDFYKHFVSKFEVK